MEKENERLIEDYIGDDYNKCLYLYLDLMKYGVTNENVKSYTAYEPSGFSYSKKNLNVKLLGCDKLTVNCWFLKFSNEYEVPFIVNESE